LLIRNSIEKNTNHPEKNRQPASTALLLWFARYGAIPSLLFLSISLLSTFFWAARPAFYYMGLIFLFVIAHFILLIAINYWPLYRVSRKKKNFPFAEARSLLPCWIALLSFTAALLVSLPW